MRRQDREFDKSAPSLPIQATVRCSGKYHEIVLDKQLRLHVPHTPAELDACKAATAMGSPPLRCDDVLKAWRKMHKDMSDVLPKDFREAYKWAIERRDHRRSMGYVQWELSWGVPYPLNTILRREWSAAAPPRSRSDPAVTWAAAASAAALARLASTMWPIVETKTSPQYEAKITDMLPAGVGRGSRYRSGRGEEDICICVNRDWYRRVYLSGISVIGDALVVEHLGTLDGNKILRAVTRPTPTLYIDQVYALRHGVLVRLGDQSDHRKRLIPSYS